MADFPVGGRFGQALSLIGRRPFAWLGAVLLTGLALGLIVGWTAGVAYFAERWLLEGEWALQSEVDPATGMLFHLVRGILEIARGRVGAALTALRTAERLPGRLLTMAQLEFLRDYQYPMALKVYARRIALLQEFGKQSEENARIAKEDLFGLQNAQKAITGYQSGLLDKSIMDQKAADEERRSSAAERLHGA